MKKTTKKLVLAKETLRDLLDADRLDADRLKRAAGGARTDYITCGVSCYYFETCLC